MGKSTDELYSILREQSKELERTKRAKIHAQVLLYEQLFPVPERPLNALEEAMAKVVYYKVELDRATAMRDQLKRELTECIKARAWDKAPTNGDQ
jgi:hypothetical protein